MTFAVVAFVLCGLAGYTVQLQNPNKFLVTVLFIVTSLTGFILAITAFVAVSDYKDLIGKSIIYPIIV
jgi:hypothetical protein